jgi:hypothetical protein
MSDPSPFACLMCGADVPEAGAGADCPCPKCPAVWDGESHHYLTPDSAKALTAAALVRVAEAAEAEAKRYREDVAGEKSARADRLVNYAAALVKFAADVRDRSRGKTEAMPPYDPAKGPVMARMVEYIRWLPGPLYFATVLARDWRDVQLELDTKGAEYVALKSGGGEGYYFVATVPPPVPDALQMPGAQAADKLYLLLDQHGMIDFACSEGWAKAAAKMQG